MPGSHRADDMAMERGVRRRVGRAVAGLHPGWFALVMATGILSTATLEMGPAWASAPLLAVAAGAYVALCALTCWRLLAYPRRALADAAAPDRAFAFFSFVAGSNVLGLRLGAAGWGPAAAGLAALGAAVWLLLTYAIPLALISTPRKPPAAASVNGTWLMWVVGTQSVASAAATFAGLEPALADALVLAAVALWGFGTVLYLLLMAVIVYRLLLEPLAPAQLEPPYWITMGATAITVFASAHILAVPGHLPVSAQSFGMLTLVLWAFGTWWFPLLVLLGIWRHLVKRVPLSYESALWSMVFPLGMYAAAGYAFGAAAGFAALELVARIEVWFGLTAWVAVFAGMLVAGLRAIRR
jgi:tellurite resistance protein TehA-like permease